MIAAFLCGLMYGALAYRAWCVRPITLKGECEPWEDPAHYGKGWGPDPYVLPGTIVDGVRRL